MSIGSRHVVIDIETENTGLDIIADNKRIIAIQLGNSDYQEVYYADSPKPERSLTQGVARVEAVISRGGILAGYNIERFDLPLLKRFCGVEVPKSNYLEIGSLGDLYAKRRAEHRSAKLEDICRDYGIPVNHKRLMAEQAERLKSRPDIISLAETGARKLAISKGWSHWFCLELCLDKLSWGQAILDAYHEYVRLDGAADTLFHRYAAGDVICEYLLLESLLRQVAPKWNG